MAVLRAFTAVSAALVIKRFRRRPLFMVNGLIVMAANVVIAAYAFGVENGYFSPELKNNMW